jgi:serine/threonine protein kinase
MEGLAFGRYRVTRKLGAGGMAEVYVAKHELMDRYAAVKVLLPEMSAREDIVKRFFQEAQAAACIEHPGIVHVYDVGYTAEGRGYLVMELLSGETLNQRLKRQKRMSIDAAVTVIRQLAGIMEVAHQSGIVHRDLKPDNIFLVSDPEMPTGERVKVLDFGLAKLVEGVTPARELTAQGAVFGTPAYMAPEQCRSAANVDGRADIYAIGCLFYACLCGKPPFGTGGIEILLAHMGTKPVPPRQLVDSIPPAIEALILRLLEKDPDKRLPTCEALIAELDNAMAATAQLVHGEAQRKQTVNNDEMTIREDATLQGTVALLGVFERAASHDGASEPDTYETSAAPPPQPRGAHMADTQRMPTQKPSPARAGTDGGLTKETRPMRKPSEVPLPATRRLQTSEPLPLPGVKPVEPPSTRPLPGMPPARAATPAPLPQPVPVQSSGPVRMPALTPMHARALRPVDIPWPAGAPEEAGAQRAGTDDDARHGRGSTPTISNGEIEAHRKRALARDRQRARSRHMLWSLAGAGVLAVLITTGLMLGPGDEKAASTAGAKVVNTVIQGDPDTSAEEAPAAETDPNLVKIDALLKQAELDMNGRNWDQAKELLQRASEHEGKDEEREKRVLEMAKRVLAEKQSQASFERMGGLKNVEKLVAEYRKIPEGSVYHAEAHALYEEARQEWLKEKGKRAEQLMKSGDCQALAGIVKSTAKNFPGAEADLAAQSAKCTPREASATGGAGDEPTAKELFTRIRADYKQGRTSAAFDQCHASWKIVAGDDDLTMLCGLAACKTKNQSAARHYYKKASSQQSRSAIAQICLAEGIDIQK